MEMNWIKVADRNPSANGQYIVATKYDVQEMQFTTLGGWNTFEDHLGNLKTEHAMDDSRIVAWMPMPSYPHELRMDCPSQEW